MFIKYKHVELNTYEKTVVGILDCKMPTNNKNRRQKVFADETLWVKSNLDERTSFRCNVHWFLTSKLARRRILYDVLVDRFEVLTILLLETSNEAIIKAATNLTLVYDDDINGDFLNERCHFKTYINFEQMQQLPQKRLHSLTRTTWVLHFLTLK